MKIRFGVPLSGSLVLPYIGMRNSYAHRCLVVVTQPDL